MFSLFAFCVKALHKRKWIPWMGLWVGVMELQTEAKHKLSFLNISLSLSLSQLPDKTFAVGSSQPLLVSSLN